MVACEVCIAVVVCVFFFWSVRFVQYMHALLERRLSFLRWYDDDRDAFYGERVILYIYLPFVGT